MTASVRQSSRAKKPSRRAEEMHQAEVVEAAASAVTTRMVASNKRQKSAGSQGKKEKKKTATKTASERTQSAGASNGDDDDGGEYEEGDSEEEEEEDEAGSALDDAQEEDEGEAEDEAQEAGDVYCLCRKGDDGRPMVFCAECTDWFHFKCVGLTKKVAENLSEYICPPCAEKTGKKSKTLDDDAGEEEAESSRAKGEAESSSSPPRRFKRKSNEVEGNRKRSRTSPQPNDVNANANVKTTMAASTTFRPTPPEPVRKSSGSQNITAPTGSPAVMKARSDTLRKHAVEQLVGTFDAILAEPPDTTEVEEGQGRTFAVAFESCLFDLNHESVAKTTIRIAGKLYRDRLRTVLFNLKDKSNTSLRQKIASKELTPDVLAAMSNDELANDEIRKEVERKKKENLQQSILKKEEAPLRKLTHKGEIDIEYEAAHTSRMVEDRQRERELQSSKEEEDTTPMDVKAVMSPVRAAASTLQGSPTIKTTPRRISTSVQSPTMPFDFANVWTEEAAREGDDEEREEEASQADGENDQVEKVVGMDDEQTEEKADNFIDDFLGMPEEKGDGKEKSQEVVSSMEESSLENEEQFRWRGVISMPEEGICTGKARQVAGRSLSENEWKVLFPSTHSIIEGRLPTASAAPYLVQSQMALRTELVVMTFELSWEPEHLKQIESGAPVSEVENSESFEKLLSYFQRRDRYGVLPPHPSARGTFVKDYYISPLPKYGMVPQWMDMMQARGFQGEFAHSRKKDMFLLVAVLFRQTPRPGDNSAFSPPQGVAAAASTVATGAVPAPVPSLSSILGGSGSNTLQDLLKAVGGGNRSPATPITTGYQSPSSQASTTTEQQQHPSIETLREMPKSQLEDMMYKNPNLVDQLLKTLGASKAPSPGPLVRPPGPPPAPPPALQTSHGVGQQRPPYMDQNNQYSTGYGRMPPQQGMHSPNYPSYDYNNQAPQRPLPPHGGGYQSGMGQRWQGNPGNYPPPGPPNHSSTPPNRYGPPPTSQYGPPVRGGFNRGGEHPGQRRY